MIAAIVKEIELSNFYPIDGNRIETIYFGGGTPSILGSGELQIILDAVHNKFTVAGQAEITLEANPDDITPQKLLQWKAVGINRLSTGIQSFSEEELAWMNRAHTAADALNCIDQIKAAGFSDFSIDLIYGSPLLSNENWKRNVWTVIEKEIPHISCYALTVEPQTALDKMIVQKKKTAVDPEKQAEQFILLMDWLAQAGYEHYEISNFAKPGMRSRHNSSYWEGKHYYGFGPSAHSFDGVSRKWNIANNALYIQSLQQNSIPFEQETLTTTQHLNEYIMTSLRTKEGTSLDKVTTSSGKRIAAQLLQKSDKWQSGGKIMLKETSLVLTREGKLFADGIAADLFFDEAGVPE